MLRLRIRCTIHLQPGRSVHLYSRSCRWNWDIGIKQYDANNASGTLTGHVDFKDFVGGNWLVPIGVEILQNGSMIGAERIYLMFSRKDRHVIRELAKEVAEISALPIMEERKHLWTLHNSLKPCRPLILIFPQGSWRELIRAEDLTCVDEEARNIELALLREIYTFHHFCSDNVVECTWDVHPVIESTGWGLEPHYHNSSDPNGAWGFDPVINKFSDLAKLRHPEIAYDHQATMRSIDQLQDLFGDILEVRFCGIRRVTFALMEQYVKLRGLEQVMMDMYLEPQMLHEAMEFLTQGHKKLIDQIRALNLYRLNNDNTFQSSGGNGYTTDLPAEGFDPDHVRTKDMWAFAESQELAEVSPEMHEEFALSYEKRLLSEFGLNGYGCCEDLTKKLDYVLQIPNIRRISISPWADVDACAEKLGRNYIFSWKPNPSHLVGDFNPVRIREYIHHTIEVAGEGNLEIVLKDTHTCEHHGDRFDQWSRINMEEVLAFAEVEFIRYSSELHFGRK